MDLGDKYAIKTMRFIYILVRQDCNIVSIRISKISEISNSSISKVPPSEFNTRDKKMSLLSPFTVVEKGRLSVK